VSEPDAPPRRPNRLIAEASPYLAQHAHNPVDWYPWGAEALEKARAEDRPIFLSIGYAACHWCHVMERESFEDERIAAFLAGSFVAIKVDREERPDLDAVYMNAVQALTGRGGWPMSVFLTPDGRPFFGGTYFPPERRHGMPAFIEVLQAVAEAWESRRAAVEHGAAELAAQLAAWSGAGEAGALDAAAAGRAAVKRLTRSYDPRSGGFGGAPKFPTPSRLFFLLRAARGEDGAADAMLRGTLDAMSAGGMYDWVGGGFHRYSVDADWLVPHFEKMLYDNALLARAYGEAGVFLGESRWTETALATARYLVREMQGPEGGFYSSTDADSDGEEGVYFTWTADEVRQALPPAEAALVIQACGLAGAPNFEHARSVLRPARFDSGSVGSGGAGGGGSLEAARAGLLAARSRRVLPALDDKCLAGWNGMAIWSLAWLGATLEEDALLAAARRAAAFVLRELVDASGRLARAWRAGRTGGAETLEDVAWVAAGLAELFQADGDAGWLRAALHVVDARLPRYAGADGVLWDSPDDGEALIARPRGALDGAAPASAAVLAGTLARLSVLAGRDDLGAAARRAVAGDAALAAAAPESATSLIDAAAALARPAASVAIVGDPGAPTTAALLRAARRALPAGAVIVPVPAVPAPPETASLVPLLAGREGRAGDPPVAYLCEGGTCRLPTGSAEGLERALRALAVQAWRAE